VLVFRLFSILFFSFSRTRLYLFPLFLFIFFFYYLISSYFSLNSLLVVSSSFHDEVSLFIVYISFLVLFFSFYNTLSLTSKFVLNLTLTFLLFSCLVVFISSNMFYLYLFYEASLLPILYIIVRWGSYPERSVRAIMLLIYTSVFSLPLILFLFYFYSVFGSFSFSLFSDFSSSFLFSFIVFTCFSVKLPIYGLHFWLPIAHVEAPTFGSIILAGVLLKLGGVGLVRIRSFVEVFLLKSVLLSYLVFFLSVVTIICCFQSDFKRLIAYSSVSHIIRVPLLFLRRSVFRFKSLILVIFFHGLSSPVLFILVGILYSIFSSRQLIVIRGLLLISPLLRFILVLAFFFTISAPPFPSFVSEVYFFSSSFTLTSYLMYSFLIFAFFSLVYNLNWFSRIVFSRETSIYFRFSLPFCFFFVFSLCFLVCISSLLLISFF